MNWCILHGGIKVKESIWLFKDILYYKMNLPEFSWHFKAADEYSDSKNRTHEHSCTDDTQFARATLTVGTNVWYVKCSTFLWLSDNTMAV